jgi:preprotein translocase subunit SecE
MDPEQARREAQEAFDEIERVTWTELLAMVAAGIFVAGSVASIIYHACSA